MYLFFSDLDNTLIYSHNREISGEKIPVEFIGGREQSYMTAFTYNFLKNAEWLKLIPVTARTIEQYRRISVFENTEYALVCCGGILLKNGQPDSEWYEETLRISENEAPAVDRAEEMLKKISARIHRPASFYVYAGCENPEKAAQILKDSSISSCTDITHDTRKVYCTARTASKGNAVKRFKKLVKAEKIISAGDSSHDISMLSSSDIAFAADEIAERVKAPAIYRIGTGVFSDTICSILNEIRNRGIF